MSETPEDVAACTSRDCQFVHNHTRQATAEDVYCCPTCGPTTTEAHPRLAGVVRCVNCKEHLSATPEGAYRAALDRLDEARRRLDAALIASAHLLETPFANAPETSPWERSVKPAMYALRRAVAAVRADGDAAYAAGREAAAQAVLDWAARHVAWDDGLTGEMAEIARGGR